MIPRHTLDNSKKIYVQLHPPQAKKCSTPHTETVQDSSPTTQMGHIHTTQHLLFIFPWASVTLSHAYHLYMFSFQLNVSRLLRNLCCSPSVFHCLKLQVFWRLWGVAWVWAHGSAWGCQSCWDTVGGLSRAELLHYIPLVGRIWELPDTCFTPKFYSDIVSENSGGCQNHDWEHDSN